MNISWIKESNIELFIREIEKNKKFDSQGDVVFENIHLNVIVSLISTQLIIPYNIPEIERFSIIYKSIFASGKNGVITPNALLIEIKAKVKEYERRPIVQYVVLTSCSLDSSINLKTVIKDDIKICFGNKVSTRYLENAAKVIKYEKSKFPFDPPTNYYPVAIHLSAKSNQEAIDSALNTFDLVRGIWNLFWNQKHSWARTFGPEHQINKIVTGPFHTLHTPHGKLVIENLWYSGNYQGAEPNFGFGTDINDMQNYYKVLRRKILASKYKREIESGIIRYVRALDNKDLEDSFLKLWSLLEYLTGADSKFNDATIRRGAFVFRDYEYQFQILKILQEYRNRAVHNSIYSEEIESYLYIVKNVVEQLLRFHIGIQCKYSSLQEACKFLDLPTKSNELYSGITQRRLALRFRGYTKE
jgi:hypothetical protein